MGRQFFLLMLAVVLFAASHGQAQNFGVFFFWYEDGIGAPNPPLTDSCGGGVPLPDGTPIYIYWDANSDGPGNNDPLAPVWDEFSGLPGVNYNQFSMNGESGMGAPGYFYSENMFINVGPFPQPWRFYLRVCGPEYRWESAVFTLVGGEQDFDPDDFVWTCISSPCPACMSPGPLSYVSATDGAWCEGINVTWSYFDDPLSRDEFRLTRDGDFLIALPESLGTSYDDTTVTPGIFFTYGVQVVRYCTDSEDSLFSNIIADSGYRQPSPPTAEDVQASDDQLDQVTVSWSYNTNVGLESWMIRRNLTTIATVPAVGVPGPRMYVHQNPPPGPALYDVIGVNMACTGAVSPGDSGEAIISAADVGALLIRQFQLHPAFPNPFNAATTVCFDLPQATRVRLEVYDLNGRRVAMLADEALLPGNHSATFFAHLLPSGLYFVQLAAGAYRQTEKVMLLK